MSHTIRGHGLSKRSVRDRRRRARKAHGKRTARRRLKRAFWRVDHQIPYMEA